MYPILEFDESREAILEPRPPKINGDIPEAGVICFFQDVLDRLIIEEKLTEVGALKSEIGFHPLYVTNETAQPILVFHPGIGAPLGAGMLEEVIALGVRNFIACGGCGVLDHNIEVGNPIILNAAVRDEGTSYHYLPPSREVSPHPTSVKALEHVFNKHKLPYRLGKTWTTDAFFRETIAKREKRLAENCIVVEMEAAAFFAVAQFRGVTFGQVVYGGDLVVPEGWDSRDWVSRHDIRQDLFRLSVEACETLLQR